ncbi:hypothetical protein B566_EDAN009414 [Ephemera danica]|nr:hypothetical protein B566_EDAN009414 [Ephemera danica]
MCHLYYFVLITMQVEDVDENLLMLRRFPLLLPNDDLKEYRGFFKAGSSEYFLDVTLPNAPAVSEMKFNHYSPNLKTILTDYRKDILQWTSSTKSFYKFVEWLQNRVNLEQAGSESDIYIMGWENIYRDIKQNIGLENLSDADEKSLEWIELRVVDLVDREHKLRVNIQVSASQYEANLPSNALKLIQTASTSIVDAYKIFEEQVMKLQKFWDVLEEIDNN